MPFQCGQNQPLGSVVATRTWVVTSAVDDGSSKQRTRIGSAPWHRARNPATPMVAKNRRLAPVPDGDLAGVRGGNERCQGQLDDFHFVNGIARRYQRLYGGPE